MMPVKVPYYESRFVRANHPTERRALWLRQTLLLPTTGEPVADVWVMAFDSDGGHRAVKVAYPLTEAEYHYDDWTARISRATLDDRAMRGEVAADGRSAQWDLRMSASGAAPVKLLTDRGYRAKFPTAKTLVRDPLTMFDGRLVIDGTEFDVDGWRGSVNHNWGRRHTPAYAFGQVCGFDDAQDASLEVVTASAAVGPVRLPPATLLVLRCGGAEFAVRAISQTRHSHGSYRPFAWSFGARIGDATVDGEITAEPSDVIGLTYHDTTGHTKYCYNSALATCRIRLTENGRRVELVATRRAMLEILLAEPSEVVPLLA